MVLVTPSGTRCDDRQFSQSINMTRCWDVNNVSLTIELCLLLLPQPFGKNAISSSIFPIIPCLELPRNGSHVFRPTTNHILAPSHGTKITEYDLQKLLRTDRPFLKSSLLYTTPERFDFQKYFNSINSFLNGCFLAFHFLELIHSGNL